MFFPPTSPWSDHPKNIWWRLCIIILFMLFFLPPIMSSVLVPNKLPETLFSYSFNPRSSLKVKNKLRTQLLKLKFQKNFAPLQVFQSFPSMKPGGQRQFAPPSVFLQMWEQPPLFMAHSSVSIQLPDGPTSNPDEHSADVEDMVSVGSVLGGWSPETWSLRSTHWYEPSVLTQPPEQRPPTCSSGSAHSSVSEYQKN